MSSIGPTPVGSMARKAPWRAKTSATSSFGRRTAGRLSLGSRPSVDQGCEPVEGAGCGPDRRVGDAGVKRRGVKLGMAQQCLDHANIDLLLKQMRGKTVPQRVRRHALCDPRSLGGGADNAAELPGRQRLDRVAAGKQPASRQQQAAPPPLALPGAQQFEQLRRQHRVAVLAPLAARDAQQHALGIDVADLERDNFRDAQPGAPRGRPRGAPLPRAAEDSLPRR